MRDLAERVNLRASSLYSHIRRKEEILQKICAEQDRRFTEAMDEVEHMECKPVEKVRILLSLHIRTALEDPTSVTVFSDEWKHLEEPYLQKFSERRRIYEQRFLNIIEEGIKGGAFKPLDANIILYTLLTAIRWLHHKQQTQPALSGEKQEQQIIELLMGGLENNLPKEGGER